MTFWIINKIIVAYIISTFAFLILILFFKSPRRRKNIFLNKANLLIVVVLLLNIIFVGEETIKCLVSESRDAKEIVEEAAVSYSRNCTSIFIGAFFFAFLFQVLFFFNRHRAKISFTIVSITLLTFFYNYERLVVYITSMYRDYLPSSWSTYYNYAWVETLWSILFAVTYFAFCWTNRKKIRK